MKKTLKYIFLSPFSLLYGIVTWFRNWLYDKKLLSSTEFSLPLICVGNLAVGGTGKTPHSEFILSHLQDDWNVALLSRGYKRETKGFVLADDACDSKSIGDEPYQIYRKFPKVKVAVDESRVHGVTELQRLFPDLQCVVLDDAFQHRKIKAGLSILLTDYSNLYADDHVMPLGRLREWRSGSRRADVIVVTKCPTNELDFVGIESRLNLQKDQELYFSSFEYDEIIPIFDEVETEKYTIERIQKKQSHLLLVTGIVSPKSIVDYLKNYTTNIESLSFPDHHSFGIKDFERIKSDFERIKSLEKLIITTEKDASRLIGDKSFPDELKPYVYALPIRVKIMQEKEVVFIEKLRNYVGKN